MAFCASCGSPVENAYCSKCGGAADAKEPSGAISPDPESRGSCKVVTPPLPKSPSKRRFILWALSGCLLLLIIAGSFIFSTGRFNIRGINGSNIENPTQGKEKDTVAEIPGSDSSLRIPTVSEGQLPEWLPPYPNTESSGFTGFSKNQGKSGSFSFKSKDPVEAVARFYEKVLKNEGFQIEKSLTRIPGEGLMMMISATESKSGRTANMTAARTSEGTIINLAFEIRSPSN